MIQIKQIEEIHKLDIEIDPYKYSNYVYEKYGDKFGISIFYNYADDSFYMDLIYSNTGETFFKGRMVVPNVPMDVAHKYVTKEESNNNFYFIWRSDAEKENIENITMKNFKKFSLYYVIWNEVNVI